MKQLCFESIFSDPDVWIRDSTRADGMRYSEYVLPYVND